MKRRYKLLLIIVIGAALTILINCITIKNKVTIVSLGDGLSLGFTPYNVAGPSFNDYLRDYAEQKNILDNYNHEFSIINLTIHELNELLEDNTLGDFSKTPIKQIIASADIITLCIGLDEFSFLSTKKNLTTATKENYLKEMTLFLKSIREFYDKKIIVVGLYPCVDFSQREAIEINQKLQKIAGTYNAHFLDIIAYQLNPQYVFNNSYYLNYLGHQKIAENLIPIAFSRK